MPGEAPTTRQIPPTPHHAAGDCELRFTTGGDAEWFAQSAEYYADNDAARSGTIGSGQETWMQTTVVGPGRIQFRFKMSWVSGDGLAFCVDEGVVASWGQSDTWDPTGWFDIPSGTHTLKWKYVKYSGSTAGSAWIDAIQWTGGVPESGGGADWEQITYTYDPSGRRIAKDVDGVVTKYLYDGDHCIAEYACPEPAEWDGDDTLLRKFIHGPRIDEPRSASLRAGSFCMLESPPLGGIEAAGSYAGTYYYHYDALGSVVALSDADGETVQVYEYDVYGQPAASDPNHPNRFMFTGREFDKETGLYYYRARYYNASIGRFLQTDPIGYGMSLYAYCDNNPIGRTDPSGCTWSANPSKDIDEAVFACFAEMGLPCNFVDQAIVSGILYAMLFTWDDSNDCWVFTPPSGYYDPCDLESLIRALADGAMGFSSAQDSSDSSGEDWSDAVSGPGFGNIPKEDRRPFADWLEGYKKSPEGRRAPDDHYPKEHLDEMYEQWKELGRPRGPHTKGPKPWHPVTIGDILGEAVKEAWQDPWRSGNTQVLVIGGVVVVGVVVVSVVVGG